MKPWTKPLLTAIKYACKLIYSINRFIDLFIEQDTTLTPVSSGSHHGPPPDGIKLWIKPPLTRLTHWARDKMAAIFQMPFSNAFSWIKIYWISNKSPLKFVHKGQINNIPTLIQTMAWRRPGDKPPSEPMLVSLLTHICVTLLQWANKLAN